MRVCRADVCASNPAGVMAAGLRILAVMVWSAMTAFSLSATLCRDVTRHCRAARSPLVPWPPRLPECQRDAVDHGLHHRGAMALPG